MPLTWVPSICSDQPGGDAAAAPEVAAPVAAAPAATPPAAAPPTVTPASAPGVLQRFTALFGGNAVRNNDSRERG